MRKIKSRVFYSILFYSILFYSILFVSCDTSFNEPVRQYFEYWSTTCQVAKVEFSSAKTTINGVENLSAKEQIQIDVFAINPKGFKLLQKDEGQCFSLQNSGGTLSYSDYSETQVDPAYIKITAKLTDASEGQTITLSGGLYPENRTGWSESQLKESAPELFTSVSFIQNTPPDNIKNLNVPEGTFSGTLKHYVSFDVPRQDLNRNKDSTYEVSYYLREFEGSVVYKGKKTLTLDDNKGTSPTTFLYYFDGQEDYLNYEYTVQVIGPRGLKSELYSTIPGLGVNELNEATITVDGLNGLKDEDDYECVEVENENAVASFTATKASDEETLTVTVDGSVVTGTGGVYTLGGIGQHTIVATSSKDGSRPISVVKKIRIVKALSEPKIEFTNASSIDGDTVKFSYLNYEKLFMDITNTYQDASITTTIDGGTAQTGNLTSQKLDVGTHTIKVTVEKEYCATQEFVKSINVGIKQITAKLTKAEINISHNTKYEGTIKLYVIGGSEQVVRSYKSKNYLRNKFNGYSVPADYYLFFNSKSSKARFETFNSKAGYDPLRDVLRDFTLAEIKASNGYLDISSESYKKADSYSSENTYHHLWLSLSEGAAPADITFSPAVSCIDEANFECIEVADSSSKASYTISARDGASIGGKIDGISFTGPKSGQLSLGEHMITVTSKQSGCTDTTVSKKIKVVQKLQEPVIKFYKESSHTNEIVSTNDNAESGMTYKLYSNYNIDLDAYGNGQLYFDVSAESGTTVTVEETTINDGEETVTAITSGSLPLGPHILTFTVSKDGNTPVSVEQKVYVQGILSDPVITSSNGTFVSGEGDEETDPQIWKFSYLNYDSLKCKVNPGNTGNTVEVSTDVTGTSISLSNHLADGFGLGYDTVVPLKIVQKREYCKTLTRTKYVQGIIKPIKLWYRNGSAGGLKGYQAIYIKNFGGAKNYDLYGDVFTKLNSGGESVIFSYGESEYPITANKWDHLNSDSSGREVVYICASPNDEITLRMNNMRRRKHDDKGHVTGKETRTLYDIKNGTGNYYSGAPHSAWTLFTGKIGDYAEIGLTFDVSEVSE